jgi:hypothetical protein
VPAIVLSDRVHERSEEIRLGDDPDKKTAVDFFSSMSWRASSTGIVGGTVTQVRVIRFRTLVMWASILPGAYARERTQ